MNKLLVAALVAGAAATVGYVVSKVRNGNNTDSDFDDDIYDDYDAEENIDFEINDDSAPAAEENAEEAKSDEAVEEAEAEEAEAEEESAEETAAKNDEEAKD